MDENFWQERWRNNQIAFHENEVNQFLSRYFQELGLGAGARVFLPLCGKTRDIAWLLAQGYRVAGAELVEYAVEQLFAELNVKPQISQHGALKLYQAPNLDLFVGDIFSLTNKTLGSVDATYDRAALVALPAEMRISYTHHLIGLTDGASQLLITYEYDQSLLEGPPFSVSQAEVERHYADHYKISLKEKAEVVGGLKKKCAAWESVWILRKSRAL